MLPQERVLRGRDIAFGDLGKLPLLEASMRETLRILPPSTLSFRELTADVELEGYLLPKGTIVIPDPKITHNLPAVYPDPGKFDPTRFKPGSNSAINQFTFVPFGGGVHKCLGAQFAFVVAKIFFSEWLKRWDWQVSLQVPLISSFELACANQ